MFGVRQRRVVVNAARSTPSLKGSGLRYNTRCVRASSGFSGDVLRKQLSAFKPAGAVMSSICPAA